MIDCAKKRAKIAPFLRGLYLKRRFLFLKQFHESKKDEGEAFLLAQLVERRDTKKQDRAVSFRA